MFGKLRISEPRNFITNLIFTIVMICLAVFVIISLVALPKFFIDRMNDPLVTYYGDVMRKSQLEAQTNQPFYCLSLSSSGSDVEWICFDSMQELDAFAASRR